MNSCPLQTTADELDGGGTNTKMPIAIKRVDFTDFEALRDVVQDQQSDVIQLGSGQMKGQIAHLALDPTFGISAGQFSLSARATGVMSDARWSLGLLLKSDGQALGHRHQFGVGDLAIAAPGEDRYVRLQNNTEYIVAMIDPQELQSFLTAQPGAYDLLLANPLSVLHATRETAVATVKHLKPLLDALENDGRTMPEGTLQFYKRNIMEILTTTLRDSTSYSGPHLGSHDNLIRKIDRYLATTGSRPVHISELCEHFHVHRRTLHRAFDEVIGIPPISYLRMKRLNAVHTALLAASPSDSIKIIANEHGFIELGRFAASYRRQFGELPSKTLRRTMHSVTTVMFLLFIGNMAYAFAECDYCPDDFITPRVVTVQRVGPSPHR